MPKKYALYLHCLQKPFANLLKRISKFINTELKSDSDSESSDSDSDSGLGNLCFSYSVITQLITIISLNAFFEGAI